MANKPIGTIGNVPTVTMGGRVFTDLDNLIYLSGAVPTGARCTLRKNNGSAGYQVTTGKTMTIYAAVGFPSTTSYGNFTLFYADNDVGQSSSTALTNGVYLNGDSASRIIFYQANNASTWGIGSPCNFAVPAQKYSGAENSNGGFIQALAYEA
jgi:hypothetical protein